MNSKVCSTPSSGFLEHPKVVQQNWPHGRISMFLVCLKHVQSPRIINFWEFSLSNEECRSLIVKNHTLGEKNVKCSSTHSQWYAVGRTHYKSSQTFSVEGIQQSGQKWQDLNFLTWEHLVAYVVWATWGPIDATATFNNLRHMAGLH